MANMRTYDQVGTVQDISGVISNITPSNTPFQTSIGRENIANLKHEWQQMALASVNLGNAAIQGADAPTAGFTATTMKDNITQILTGTVGVTGSVGAVKTHGRANELALQLANKGKELKRDLEAILLSSQARVVGNGTDTAGKMTAAQGMILAGNKFHAGDATTTLDGADLDPFNETVLLAANQALYNAGGEATILQIKPNDARIVAGFAAVTGRLRDMEGGRKIVNVVDVYEGPHGKQKIVLNRFQKVTDALLYDPDNWKLLILRNWFRETLAKTGDSVRIQLLGEFSLKHANDGSSALITDLS